MKNIIKTKSVKALHEADEKLNLNADEIINDKALEKEGVEKDSTAWKITKAIGKMLGKALTNYSADKAGDLIDELLVGQFKDSLIDIYKKEKFNNMSDEDAKKELEEMQKNSKFKQGSEYSKLDSRKDDVTSTEIDSDKSMYSAAWFSADKDENVGKVLSDLVATIQKQAKETEEQQTKLKSDLKAMKVDISDEDFNNFGPVLLKMVDEKKSTDEIKKKLEELKKGVKESCDWYVYQYKKSALLTESKFMLTEDLKQQILFRSICENKDFQDACCYMICKDILLTEGWALDAFKKVSGLIPDKVKSKVKDFTTKTIQTLTSKTMNGILALGGLAAAIYTGGWAATAILRVMYIIEKQGKKIRNAFERCYTRFANSRGIMTQMDFALKESKNKKYSMRFYAKDMVWRVINTEDQLKHPGLKWSKEIVNGPDGKKYRERLAAIWDPLFSEEKGGKVDFEELFKQAKGLDIPEKALNMYKDFREQYSKIKSAAIDSPKIDTRTQALKKDKLDK